MAPPTPSPYAGKVPNLGMQPRRPVVAWRKESAPAAAVQVAVITLIVLRLAGVITWSWWWVLSPLWIGGLLAVIALCGLVVVVRRQARRRMRVMMDVSPDQWQAWLMARPVNPDASDGDVRRPDGGGQAPGPPDG
jgi:hypothetical protein